MKNTQIILSLENDKKWWEKKLKKIIGKERREAQFKKLTPYMAFEIFGIFLTVAFQMNFSLTLGALSLFLAHCIHLEIERKRGINDKDSLEKKIKDHVEEWSGIVSLFEEIFCEDWGTKTVKSFEAQYELKKGLADSDLRDYEVEIQQKLIECMLYAQETYNAEEVMRAQGAYAKMRDNRDHIKYRYDMAGDNENCYLHEIVQMYKERIAQWAHT